MAATSFFSLFLVFILATAVVAIFSTLPWVAPQLAWLALAREAGTKQSLYLLIIFCFSQ